MKLFLKTLLALNMVEGFSHFITATLSYWGMYEIGVWDWRILTASTADLVFGVVSLVTGIIFGKGLFHHHE